MKTEEVKGCFSLRWCRRAPCWPSGWTSSRPPSPWSDPSLPFPALLLDLFMCCLLPRSSSPNARIESGSTTTWNSSNLSLLSFFFFSLVGLENWNPLARATEWAREPKQNQGEGGKAGRAGNLYLLVVSVAGGDWPILFLGRKSCAASPLQLDWTASVLGSQREGTWASLGRSSHTVGPAQHLLFFWEKARSAPGACLSSAQLIILHLRVHRPDSRVASRGRPIRARVARRGC